MSSKVNKSCMAPVGSIGSLLLVALVNEFNTQLKYRFPACIKNNQSKSARNTTSKQERGKERMLSTTTETADRSTYSCIYNYSIHNTWITPTNLSPAGRISQSQLPARFYINYCTAHGSPLESPISSASLDLAHLIRAFVRLPAPVPVRYDA